MSNAARELYDLRAELAAAKAELARSNVDVSASEAMIANLKLEIANLKLEIAMLKRDKYGHKAERTARLIDQLELQLEELETAAAEDATHADQAEQKTTRVRSFDRRKPVKKPLPDHLPRERVVVEAPAACTCCGSGRIVKMGEDVSETFEVVPRQWKVIQTVREKFTCRDCEKISQPPAPFHPIPRGWAGPSLLAIINLSFADKSMFLGELIADGIEMHDAGEILNVSDRHLRRMWQVYEIVGPDCLKAIGSASNTGRRGWAEMIHLMGQIGVDKGREVIVGAVTSNPDDRFQAALMALRNVTGVHREELDDEPSERLASKAAPIARSASRVGSRPGRLLVRSRTKTDFGEVRVKSRADKVRIEIEGNEAIAGWVVENVDALISVINEKHSSAEGSKDSINDN